uniref:Kinesin motor domain-containing protein n=1 Tax=Schistosoma curassoni TaxID=6186 RepID=A0A183L1A8_9TREM
FPKLRTARKPASISDCTAVLRSFNPSLTRKRNIFSNHIGDWFDISSLVGEKFSVSKPLGLILSSVFSSLLPINKLCLNNICDVDDDDVDNETAGASDSRVKIMARPMRSRHLSGDSGQSIRPILSCTAGSRVQLTELYELIDRYE